MYVEPDGSNQIADIVVLGSGPGGLAAVGGAVASSPNVTVIAVEAADRIGGNGTYSTGWVTFVDSELQRSQGIKDSVDRFMDDCLKNVAEASPRYSGTIWDLKLTRLYARESSKMYDVMVERGVNFTRLIQRPLQASVDRLAAVEDTRMFARAFEPDFAGPRGRTYVNTSAFSLIIENGHVKGVRVRHRNGQTFEIRAKKGVILACGGFQANPELRRRYEREETASSPFLGLETCRGDGHLLGQSAGGDLINMTNLPPVILIASAMVDEALAVNIHGLRFHDEAGPYHYRLRELLKQPKCLAYYIFDHYTFTTKQRYMKQLREELVSANTIAELAAKIAVPVKAVEQTVAKYNEFLASNAPREPDTGRVAFAPDRHQITQAPFYATRMVPGVGLSIGGFTTTESMQVVDVFGRAIPGLFAVGDCAGGITPTENMGGTHLGGGFTLGWVAGRAVATDQLAPVHTIAPFGQFMPQVAEPEDPLAVIDISTVASKL